MGLISFTHERLSGRHSFRMTAKILGKDLAETVSVNAVTASDYFSTPVLATMFIADVYVQAQAFHWYRDAVIVEDFANVS